MIFFNCIEKCHNYKSFTISFYWTTLDNLPSMTKEMSCLRIPIKEVHFATNNLDLSNFIGQGVAGENACDLTFRTSVVGHDKFFKRGGKKK